MGDSPCWPVSFVGRPWRVWGRTLRSSLMLLHCTSILCYINIVGLQDDSRCPLPPVVYVWPLPLWIRTTCLTEKTLRNDSVWLLRLGRKRHDGFHWLFDHLFRGMPSVCCEGIRATLQRNPCGERLRPPAHSHVCVPSWKRSPWVQMTTTPGNVMTVNVWRTESELPS